MRKCLYFFSLTLIYVSSFAQGTYAPDASTVGTRAIHKDSSVFVSWANNCLLTRGWQNILDTTLGRASVGSENSPLNKPGVNGIVSLGDKGEAILTFEHPIINGIGPDFAVFENAFDDYFLELAFVEVSSDGINYVRFPAYSETQDTAQVESFGLLDASKLYNLAGKYRSQFGTPFDLEELVDSVNIDINNINYIKIIDVIGLINNSITSHDNNHNQINDPFPTPYPSSGFDLDAVGVIHQFVGVDEQLVNSQNIYPNPTNKNFTIQYNNFEEKTIRILEASGKTIDEIKTSNNRIFYNKTLRPGIYIIHTKVKNQSIINKIIVY